MGFYIMSEIRLSFGGALALRKSQSGYGSLYTPFYEQIRNKM